MIPPSELDVWSLLGLSFAVVFLFVVVAMAVAMLCDLTAEWIMRHAFGEGGRETNRDPIFTKPYRMAPPAPPAA
jgi:hypothetical protein